MKKMYIVLFVIFFVLAGWSLFSYFFERSIETPPYTVLEEKDSYEVREYKPYIKAQVEVEGEYKEALSEGFRILADYIFGNNTKKLDIAMTAPVTESSSEKMSMTAPVSVAEGEVMAMTAPVSAGDEAGKKIISFVMPSKYTLDTLPKPNNEKVKIVLQPERKVAVLRFSWYATESKVNKKKEELLSFLKRDGVSPKGSPEYSGYNAPFSAPWLNRNEVMVEVE